MKAGRKVSLLLLLVVMATVALGAVPSRISYQGSLTGSGGAAIPDASYRMRFTMFDAVSGGTQLWQETQTGVAVTGGLFSVELGAATALPASVFNAANLYLEVEVDLNGNASFDTNEKYSPRQHVTAGAYARVAERTVGGAQYEALVAPSGGDYTTIQDALADGKKTIFVRNGTYVLTSDINITTSGTVIIGESRDGVVLDCNGTDYGIRATGDTEVWSAPGTVTVAHGSSTVTGSGTDWVARTKAGEYIRLGGEWYKIASVDSATQLTLVEAYGGPSLSGAYHRINGMLVGLGLQNVTVKNGNPFTGAAIIWRQVLKGEIVNCAVETQSTGIGLYGIHHCKISRNLVRYAGPAIDLGLSDDNVISENSCSDNDWYAIDIGPGERNTISGNSCNNNYCGIYVENWSYNNTISGNSCENNSTNGIRVDNYSDFNTVSANSCTRNTQSGIYVSNTSRRNSIVGNTCSENTQAGIYLDTSGTNGVSGNTCSNNTGDGIMLYNSDVNTVSGNLCRENGGIGIFSDSSDANSVSGNSCYSNGGAGISLDASDNNTVSGNSSRANGGDGILLTNDADTNTLMGNSSSANTGWGINVATSNCNTNSSVGNQMVGNTAGQGQDLGTGTIKANNNPAF